MFECDLQPFFIVDTCRCRDEYDDPKDAILFFYPSHIPENYQCTLCCQLMGVVEFYGSFFSLPKTLYLEGVKFVVRKCEQQYLLCLGCLSAETPDYLLSKCLDFMYGLFTFYHGSFNLACSEARDLNTIWTNCLAATFSSGTDGRPAIFIILPWLQIAEKPLYLRASHLVESCTRYPWYLAGCLFYNGELVFTQIEPSQSAFLSCFKQVAHIVNATKDFFFASVYLSNDKILALNKSHNLPKRSSDSHGSLDSTSNDKPIVNADSSLESLTNTVDSCQGSNSISDFPDYLNKGFCDSFENSLSLIHRVTCNSLENLNVVCSGTLKPRHRRRSQKSGTNNRICLANQKEVIIDMKKEISCDSSFFDAPPFHLANHSISEELCMDLCQINKPTLCTEKMYSIPIGKEEEPIDLTKSYDLLSSGEPTKNSFVERKEDILKKDVASNQGASVLDRDRSVEEDVEKVFKLALYVFRQGETDLCLLMDDKVTNIPELVESIAKTTENPLKNLNQSFQVVGRVEADKSTASFSVDNYWQTFSGNLDGRVESWGLMKEDFALNPTLKCLTVMNLKGTMYAHSSLTHDVFNSICDSNCYSPGVPDSQSVMAKISTFSKRTFNKLGYFILK